MKNFSNLKQYGLLFLVRFLFSLFLLGSLLKAQTNVGNNQMTVTGDYMYKLSDPSIPSGSPYVINIVLKKPSELNSTTVLQAPEILVPNHKRVYLKIDGDASAHNESYGFFKFSKKNWHQNQIFSPFVGTDFFGIVNIAESEEVPNITDIIDGDAYISSIETNYISSSLVISTLFDNRKNYQLLQVPVIYYWNSNREGNVNVHLEGTIGCDKKEYKEWKWSPKKNKSGKIISVTLDLPITIFNDQDQH